MQSLLILTAILFGAAYFIPADAGLLTVAGLGVAFFTFLVAFSRAGRDKRP